MARPFHVSIRQRRFNACLRTLLRRGIVMGPFVLTENPAQAQFMGMTALADGHLDQRRQCSVPCNEVPPWSRFTSQRKARFCFHATIRDRNSGRGVCSFLPCRDDGLPHRSVDTPEEIGLL